jgi:hypothetical protein
MAVWDRVVFWWLSGTELFFDGCLGQSCFLMAVWDRVVFWWLSAIINTFTKHLMISQCHIWGLRYSGMWGVVGYVVNSLLPNVGNHSPHDAASHPRRSESSTASKRICHSIGLISDSHIPVCSSPYVQIHPSTPYSIILNICSSFKYAELHTQLTFLNL